RHTRFSRDWSSDVCSSDLIPRDYLHLGLADIKLATQNNPTDEALFSEGITQLEKAVAADSSIADDLNDVGKEIFGDKKFLEASRSEERRVGKEGRWRGGAS